MTQILVALGANLPSIHGDVTSTLASAVSMLETHPDLDLQQISRWYQTPAFPPGAGPDFINAAAAFESALPPREVLTLLHEVESEMGRTRPVRWAPRVCDLDLLAYGGAVLPDLKTARHWLDIDSKSAGTIAPDQLILPHPRMHERGFVLMPLADVAADWVHPVLHLSVAEMLARLPDKDLAEIRPI